MGHAAVELAKEGKPLHFLAMHTPMICPFLLGPDALDIKKCAALNTLGGYVAYFCFMYLVGPHTGNRLRYVPTEEEFKSLSLLHAVDWATVKDLPVLFITAAKDFHSAHAHNDKLEVLLKEKGVNFTRVDCEGFHALPEKLDVLHLRGLSQGDGRKVSEPSAGCDCRLRCIADTRTPGNSGLRASQGGSDGYLHGWLVRSAR